MLRGNLDRVRTVVGLQYRVSALLQQTASQCPNRLFVFHQQDRFCSSKNFGRRLSLPSFATQIRRPVADKS